MPLAQANGITISYQAEGEADGVPLIMITGTGFPGAVYRTGPSALLARAGFRVITYDHRGVGGSDKPDVPYTTRMFAKDAGALLESLGISRAHVLGHSMGGRVAQWMALDDPQRVRSLVLVASGAGQSDPGFTMIKGIPLDTTVELTEKGYEGYIKEHFASPFYFTPAFVEKHPEVAQAQFRSPEPARFGFAVRASEWRTRRGGKASRGRERRAGENAICKHKDIGWTERISARR